MSAQTRISRRTRSRPPQKRRILVADDDPAIVNLIRIALEEEFEVVGVEDGLQALKRLQKEPFDLLILDIMMPYVDGFAVLYELRKTSDLPVIILTAREGTHDVVQGFELGADDYLTKPFRVLELVARVKAILRRVDEARRRQEPEVLEVGDLRIDIPRHQVWVRGEEVHLTPMEFALLSFLARRPGHVFDRPTLYREVWKHEEPVGETNLVDVCVRRLREKIEENPSKPRYVLTVRGVGYKLNDNP